MCFHRSPGEFALINTFQLAISPHSLFLPHQLLAHGPVSQSVLGDEQSEGGWVWKCSWDE